MGEEPNGVRQESVEKVAEEAPPVVTADSIIDDLARVLKESGQKITMEDIALAIRQERIDREKKEAEEKERKKHKKKSLEHTFASFKFSERSKSPDRSSTKKEKVKCLGFEKVSSEEDDLPLGADFSTLQETITQDAFPLEKDFIPPKHDKLRKSVSRSPSPAFTKPDILKIEGAEKAKNEFIPRAVRKIAIAKISIPSPSQADKDEKVEIINAVEAPIIKNVANGALETAKDEAPKTERPTDIAEISDGEIPESTEKSEKKKGKEPSARERSASASSDDSLLQKKVVTSTKGRGTRLGGMRSEGTTSDKPRRSGKDGSPSRKEKSSRRSRSRSGSRSRGTKRKRSSSRDRRRSRSRKSHRKRSRSRSRDRSKKDRPERIDKAKLLSIAKRKSKLLKQMGIMTATGEPTHMATASGKSVEELVEYCQKVSRREEKAAQRKRGETVSSDSDFDDFMASVKHPYAVQTSQNIGGITINIANAIPLPIRSAQERLMDESTLRICYPVSSGAIHKEKSDNEWRPVEKETVPVTVTSLVKQHKAVTSLQAEEAKKNATPVAGTSTFIPPPPAPPSFDNLLAGPGPPPSFGDPLLPPPPLPPMFVPAPENKIILNNSSRRRDKTVDVGKVLAERAAAAQRLEADPNDYDARKIIRECDEDMEHWATQSRGGIPGQFTGSTGVRTLSADQLQPHDPRFHAWVKKTRPKVTTWDSASSSGSEDT
ncbi:unnamed protein product, partial [Mesorhabditis spiculigera]